MPLSLSNSLIFAFPLVTIRINCKKSIFQTLNAFFCYLLVLAKNVFKTNIFAFIKDNFWTPFFLANTSNRFFAFFALVLLHFSFSFFLLVIMVMVITVMVIMDARPVSLHIEYKIGQNLCSRQTRWVFHIWIELLEKKMHKKHCWWFSCQREAGNLALFGLKFKRSGSWNQIWPRKTLRKKKQKI